MQNIENIDDIENRFQDLLFHINFYYEDIFSEELILNFIVNSDGMINRYKTFFPNFTRRQLECAYLAMTLIMIEELSSITSNFFT